MVPRAFFATWNRHECHRQKQSDDPCLKFYGLWLITIMDANGVYIYISINIHYKPHSHPLYIKIFILRNLLYLDLTDVLF